MKEKILDFEKKAWTAGVSDTDQPQYAFYDLESSEYYIVRNEVGEKFFIEFIPLFLDITEVTIIKPKEDSYSTDIEIPRGQALRN